MLDRLKAFGQQLSIAIVERDVTQACDADLFTLWLENLLLDDA